MVLGAEGWLGVPLEGPLMTAGVVSLLVLHHVMTLRGVLAGDWTRPSLALTPTEARVAYTCTQLPAANRLPGALTSHNCCPPMLPTELRGQCEGAGQAQERGVGGVLIYF